MANKKFPSECIERVSPTFLDKLLIWNSETGESDNFVVIQKLYDIFTTLRDIVSIIKTSTEGLVDTYTITYHDGATSTFQVTNGEKGDTGNGIESIVKTSTSGLVDTYTITFTESDPTTFTVTNGKGISSISKTSTSGITDTYTITYTDGATSSYSVVNGKGITNIEKTSTSGLVDTYTITYNDGSPSSFTISNGKGITTIAKTSTEGLVDTYTITFNDGATTTFPVTNGAKGDTGNGISSILKTGTSGLVDTYTITFSSGDTTTFTVTNGATPEPKQTTGTSETDVMSQKAVTDSLALKDDTSDAIERHFKTLRIGASGLTTLSPTTSYATYRLNVIDNIIINIDLNRMIEQVGNARCRLIIDMPVKKTITITNPILWGGTAPTFATAGQYIIDIIDVDGTNVPLAWLVASSTKVQTTGVILHVDSTGADYSVGQINGETATREANSWATPFKYLQNAINAATAGDIIFVKQGIYKPTHLRTTPTVYVDGDRLNRNATFTPKNGVDIYGGFVGTETKTWQRVLDVNGYPVNKTILCGDIADEAAVDPAKTVGDTRTDASKANAAYNVVFGKAISTLTYLNGVNVRYGNASDATGDQSAGGGICSAALFVGINNTAYNNTATTGGGWYLGINTNCTAYNNTGTNGGGWRDGTNTNCTAYNNTATTGGGWYLGINTNCTAYNNTGTNGGGWNGGTNTNCTAYNNTATTNGGGWNGGTNTNCTAYNNTATTSGGGWNGGTNTNCTAYNNTGTTGGGWTGGTNINCTGVNNKAPQAVFGSAASDTHINCLLYNNKTSAGVAVGFDNKTATGIKIFRNNAYDVAHPTITGGAGSDINIATCIANLTAEQVKIDVPTFIGAATTPEQLAELHAYAATITTKLKPKAGSILKGAGVNNATYPNPTDYEGTVRPEASTIGILEGE